MTTRVEHREQIANAAVMLSVHLDRETLLSNDLTTIIHHQTSRLVLQIGHGSDAVAMPLSQDQAREVRDAIDLALSEWTEERGDEG